MSDLVGNPEDRFSRVAAHIIQLVSLLFISHNLDGQGFAFYGKY